MLWRRRSGGRHARGATQQHGLPDPALLTVAPARIGAPVPQVEDRGLVRLVFEDGSAVALDAHDPRARAFRALADGMLEGHRPSRAVAEAQGVDGEADPHEESDGGAVPDGSAPGERGRG